MCSSSCCVGMFLSMRDGAITVCTEREETSRDGLPLSLSSPFFYIDASSQRYLVSGHRWIAMEDWLLSTIQGCGSEQPAVHVWVIWFPEIHSNFGGLLLSPTPGQHFSVGQWEQTMTVTKLHQPSYISNVQNTGRVGKHKGSFVQWWVAVFNLYFCTQMKMLPKNIMEGYGYPLAQK